MRWLGGCAAVGATAVVLSGCSSDTVGIREAIGAPSDSTIELGVLSCQADFTVDVEEQSDQVTLTVHAKNGSNSDCSDQAFVQLDRALGERTVVDGSTGEVLVLTPPEE